MTVRTDLVDEVLDAIDASPDPAALRTRLLGELRRAHTSLLPSDGRDRSDAELFHAVLTAYPHVVESCRQRLAAREGTKPLEGSVTKVVQAHFGALLPEVVSVDDRSFAVSWPAGSATVDGMRVSWPANSTVATIAGV